MKAKFIRRSFNAGGSFFLSAILSTFFIAKVFSQAPEIEWDKTLGGTLSDQVTCIQQTSDEGYVVGGYSTSNDGDVSGNHGNEDFWAVKMDAAGNIQWQKCLGGAAGDQAHCIQQTTDGGYVMAGYTNSKDGDVTGKHLSSDVWVVKLDFAGNMLWQKCLGGAGYDNANSIRQTMDGGYIVAGETSSNNADVNGNHGGSDFWVVKLDTIGNIVWQKCLGGSLYDVAWDIQQTADGGYVVTGETNSNDGDVSGNHGIQDFWVVKLDPVGNIGWQKCLGGTGTELARSIEQTADGGYVVAGNTTSTDGDVIGNDGGNDFWVVKLDTAGNIEWQKSLGGAFIDVATSVTQTFDGGYIVAGETDSNNGDVSGNHGNKDFWMVKLDHAGNLKWQKCLGGSNSEYNPSVQQTADGGYVLAGNPLSNDGDISGNHGSTDTWVAKLYAENAIVTNSISPLNYFQNDQVNVAYTATGTFNAGNIFTAKLSDATGNFSSSVTIGSLASTTSGTINATIPLSTSAGTGYRIRVVSSDPLVIGSDNGEDITINPICGIPTGEYTDAITSNSVKINWDDVSGTEGYKVRYKVSGTSEWTTIQSNDNDKTLGSLTSNTQYTWQVKTICSVKPIISSEWSVKQFFTTNSLKLSSEKEMELEIYPNPFSSSTIISFSLEEDAPVTIDIFDLAGKEIKSLVDENLSEGNHEIQLNREQLSAGIYFLRLKLNAEVMTRRVVIE